MAKVEPMTRNESDTFNEINSVFDSLVTDEEHDDISFLSFHDELPTDIEMESTVRSYIHTRNVKLNQSLDLSLALAFSVAIGLGIGNFLGWSNNCMNQRPAITGEQLKLHKLIEQQCNAFNNPSSPLETVCTKCCKLLNKKQNLILDEDMKQICNNINLPSLYRENCAYGDFEIDVGNGREQYKQKYSYDTKFNETSLHENTIKHVANSETGDKNQELKYVTTPITILPNVKKQLPSLQDTNLFSVFDTFVHLLQPSSEIHNTEFQIFPLFSKINIFDKKTEEISHTNVIDTQDPIEMADQNMAGAFLENHSTVLRKQKNEVIHYLHLINANLLADLLTNVKEIVHFADKLVSSVVEEERTVSLNGDIDANLTRHIFKIFLNSVSGKVTDLYNFVASPFFNESLKHSQKVFIKMSNTIIDSVDKLLKITGNILKKEKPLKSRLQKLCKRCLSLTEELDTKWEAYKYKWMGKVNEKQNKTKDKKIYINQKREIKKFTSNKTNRLPKTKKQLSKKRM